MTNPDVLARERGSFRDRNNQVYLLGNRVLRGLSEKALENWRHFEQSKVYRRYAASGNIVASRVIDDSAARQLVAADDRWAACLEHVRVPFINYSYEWCFEMLKDAALLHLELMENGLCDNLILKDASAFNIQFVGAQPVFIDIPSFEQYVPGTPWVGFRQFCQHFLYPLMLQSYKRVSFRPWLRGNVDGISPEECSRLMSLRDMLRPGVFSLVYLQSKLVAALGNAKTSMLDETRDSEFGKEIIFANIKKLRRIIRKLDWSPPRSEWSEYESTHSYDAACFNRKSAFVRKAAAQRHRQSAWDIGCNTGHFSRILAEGSDYVVAMDVDELAVQRFYHELKQEKNRNILPLVCDVTNPSPRLGWRCEERLSLLDRETPALVLCLALVHHLVITGNIPLVQVMDWLATFKCEVVIEMLTKKDPMVQKLLLNKTDQYPEFTVEGFEAIAARYFVTQEKEEIMPDRRFLYHLAPLTGN
ncbi:MAG TPA: class I SAM-dependent methyltransferase [Candidatus Hydrogenedentes bacterium]|nr:class I SAM-dependent methyltransferase [Candidatus Hydrogenedentota bacterium]